MVALTSSGKFCLDTDHYGVLSGSLFLCISASSPGAERPWARSFSSLGRDRDGRLADAGDGDT